ncbi:MAG TPA: carboxylating nicotinate-nucleotide diphosphorylase [Spirochaetes bacterium]|nr:carboxylating nicotinate-nucleotide diphosphorylase [Spirochaetota bacterium]
MRYQVTDLSPADLVIRAALSEDLCVNFGKGLDAFLRGETPDFIDVTTDAVFSAEEKEAHLMAKSSGIISGAVVFKKVYGLIDPGLAVTFYKKDGEGFKKQEKIASLKGRMRSILAGERTALNFLGHLSGIATETGRLTGLLSGTGIRILDTRKTLPGLRELEKTAVVHGGGVNHRMGLYDMVLIKDNHIDGAGSIAGAVNRVRTRHSDKYKIEVECRSLEEVREALSLGVDRIMLDNMTRSTVKKAVKIVNRKTEIEVSGNMNRRRIKKLRKVHVDYISAGCITYAAGNSDFSMKIKPDP